MDQFKTMHNNRGWIQVLGWWVCLCGAFLFPSLLHAQDPNGISRPASGETIAGAVVVEGTAVDPNFLRYELAFLQEARPEAGWIVFAEGNAPVTNGTLGVWDTTIGRATGTPAFPDGRYQLRLRVVRSDYNYNEYYATNITLLGSTPTPTPQEATAVPGNAIIVATLPPSSGDLFVQLTPIPSLTPFPTPSRVAGLAADNGSVIVTLTPSASLSGGLLGQWERVSNGRFGAAFWQGAGFSLSLFLFFAAYLLIRSVWRTLRRLFRRLFIRL